MNAKAESRLVLLTSGILIAVLGIAASTRADEGQPERQIKLIKLQQANCVDMLELMDAVMDDEDLRMAADPRTNTLVFHGKPTTLNLVEAILSKLDDEVPAAPKAEATVEQFHREFSVQSVVASPTAGTIVSVTEEGRAVRKGEVILQLEGSDQGHQQEFELEPALTAKSQEQQVALAKSHAEQTLAAERQLNLARLRLNHAEAEVEMEQKQLQLELTHLQEALRAREQAVQSRKTAFASGTGDHTELATALSDLAETRGAMELAALKQKFLESSAGPLRVAEASAEVEVNHMRVQQLRSEAKTVTAESQANEQRTAMLRDRRQRETSNRLEVRAPMDGVVEFIGPLKQGARIRANQPLLRLTQLRR